MAELKTRKTTASVDDFLNDIADPRRREDCWAVARMMQEVTGSPPSMWGDSIVGFGSYRYTNTTGKAAEWPVAGFASRKQDLTLYIMSGFDQYEALLGRLGKHKTGKACLYIKRLADVDQAVLRELVAQSVAHVAATND